MLLKILPKSSFFCHPVDSSIAIGENLPFFRDEAAGIVCGLTQINRATILLPAQGPINAEPPHSGA